MWGECGKEAVGEGAEGDEEGDVACRLGIKQLVRREMRRKVRRGLRTSMYIEGTCKLQKEQKYPVSQHLRTIQQTTHLKTMTKWPFELTGFARSRYTVKLSSRQRISGPLSAGRPRRCMRGSGPPVACAENSAGELGALCRAFPTMPHMGQPLFEAKAIFPFDEQNFFSSGPLDTSFLFRFA